MWCSGWCRELTDCCIPPLPERQWHRSVAATQWAIWRRSGPACGSRHAKARLDATSHSATFKFCDVQFKPAWDNFFWCFAFLACSRKQRSHWCYSMQKAEKDVCAKEEDTLAQAVCEAGQGAL